ncbi:MAG: DUF1501 domain-containing protein [Tahibacter sp.]
MAVNRREFLRRSICSAMGGVSLYSALGSLRLVNAAAQSPTAIFPDYRALVCVYLYGGNDSFNMIVPRDNTHYNTYAASRGNLKIAQGSLLALNPTAAGMPSDGAQYGLHPSMTELAALFNSGKVAVLGNVGTLLYPTTQAQYNSVGYPLPPQLFSHDDQTNYWQTSIADDANANGWGGRIADLLYAGNPNQNLSMLMSLSGENLFQRGELINQYIMNPFGVQRVDYLDEYLNGPGATAFNAMFQQSSQANVFERAYAGAMNSSIANYQAIDAALTSSGDVTTVFPESSLGGQLKMVARLIKARNTFNMRRQVFFVSIDGFDFHSTQLTDQANTLADLSQSLKAFNDAIGTELNLGPNVTTFTASDFGRTVSTNGDGTDHGWGGHHFVMGGAVRGQRFYGSMPSLLQNGNPDDAGYGQLIPTTSVDQYAATLATWFGVPGSDLATIFPNVGRFATANLGFLNP